MRAEGFDGIFYPLYLILLNAMIINVWAGWVNRVDLPCKSQPLTTPLIFLLFPRIMTLDDKNPLQYLSQHRGEDDAPKLHVGAKNLTNPFTEPRDAAVHLKNWAWSELQSPDFLAKVFVIHVKQRYSGSIPEVGPLGSNITRLTQDPSVFGTWVDHLESEKHNIAPIHVDQPAIGRRLQLIYLAERESHV